jgi:CBS domain-containing protein
MTIASVLRDKGSAVETVTADSTVFDAVRRLGEKRIGALPVVEDGRIAASSRSAMSSTAFAITALKCSTGPSRAS